VNYRVLVRVMPRTGLLDPQGQAVESALHVLGFGETSDVHVGKSITLTVKAGSKGEAETRTRQMCDKLLANPVTEDYLIEVTES
jgi:phosphoribosylformylglycinamidine synthase PurS subunit